MSNFFKHIIIGSGAAGSMVATELIKKNSSVAIIEEGRSFDSNYFKAKKIATRNKNLWRNGGLTAFFGKPLRDGSRATKTDPLRMGQFLEGL